jgi:hypothetical protein
VEAVGVGVAIDPWAGLMEEVVRGHFHGMFQLLLHDTGLRGKRSRGILKRYVYPND